MNQRLAQALQGWQDKLTALRVAEVTITDAAAKFKLNQDIEECKEKIKEIKEELNQQKPLEKDNFTQYREKVREYLTDHRLSELEQIKLEADAERLGLSSEEARQIVEEEMKPLRRARQYYGNLLGRLMDKGYDFANPEAESLLKEAQQEAKLMDWEAKEIYQSVKWEKQLKTFNFETITVNQRGEIARKERKQAHYFTEDLGNGIILEMVEIAGGKSMMGTEDREIERLCQKYNGDWFKDERPQHEVNISSFCMGKYPIAQEQWRAVALSDRVEINLEPDPSYFKGSKNPVERVSWPMAVEFCKRLSKLTGKEYKLSSEAQWEYACRAGTKSPFYLGETITTDLANYRGTDWEYEGTIYPGNYGEGPKGVFREQTTPVGEFPPNGFGLYDMHGNVWEWCEDDWHENYQGVPLDGSAWLDRNNFQQVKCLRGGSWSFYPAFCRSAIRLRYDAGFNTSDIGFRVVGGAPGLFVPSNT